MNIDAIFMGKIRQGNAEAFEFVYNTYAPQLINYSVARLSSLEESRDLVHDVFVSFYERRDTLQITVSIRAYLFTSLKYKIVDHIRKNRHQQFYKEMVKSMNIDVEEAVFENVVYKNLNLIMDKEVERLPVRMRKVFMLSRKQHLSISQIASEMNISEQTVKNQISSALKKLRVVLDRIAIFILLLLQLF